MKEETLIEVKPRVMGNKVRTEWGVYVDGELLATSKHHFACDFFADKLAGMCENTQVDHHPELVNNPYNQVGTAG